MNADVVTSPNNYDVLIGESAAIKYVRQQINLLRPVRETVLITGETGTGKELVARALHENRGHGAFIPVDCGALPASLATSELFGHVKGAFTGADTPTDGLIAAANRGTLFLDDDNGIRTSTDYPGINSGKLESDTYRRTAGIDPERLKTKNGAFGNPTG